MSITHLLDAHLPKVDEVKTPRPRQAGSMLMASARIEADANCRPGDSLTPVLRKHAATYAERVRTEAPEYMQQVGAGGELVPASMLGENSRALEYRSTVDRPDCVAIEASRDRLELADKAGALEMGLDLADTIQADNSMEKMLVHQMAAAHNSAMRMNGRCRLHGGKSTGPRTPEGLERSRRARLVHGYYTAEAKAARADARRTMRELQLLLREVGAPTG